MNRAVQTSPDILGIPHALASSDLVQTYRDCELRSLISSRLLGLDQKIIHLRPLEGIEMERKRVGFSRASELFSSRTGVPFAPVEPAGDSRTEFTRMKLSILEAVRASRLTLPEGLEWKRLSASPQTTQRFGYATELKKVFGDNLSSVILYGSANFSDSPGDYDNYAIVFDLSRAYEQVKDFQLCFEGRKVHLNLLPYDLAETLLVVAAMPTIRSPWLQVIEGEARLPVLSERIIFFQGRARAVELLTRRQDLLLVGAEEVASNLLALPRDSAEAVFSSLAHLTAIMIEWAGNFADDPTAAPLTKRAILRRLGEQGFRIPSFAPDRSELIRQLKASLQFSRDIFTKHGELSKYCD